MKLSFIKLFSVVLVAFALSSCNFPYARSAHTNDVDRTIER